MAALPTGEFLLPLFPLPNLVFFPGTRLPLHVFEPRYRQLVTDAIAGDERFGVVLLRPGWETDYFGSPDVHAFGTAGVIEQSVPLEDGRFNVLLRGEARVRIIEEVSREPYRVARVVVSAKEGCAIDRAYAQRTWLTELSQQYLRYLPDQEAVPEIEAVGLEALTNALIMSLQLPVEEKQRLLELDTILGRAESIGTELQNRLESLQFLAPFRREGGDPSRN